MPTMIRDGSTQNLWHLQSNYKKKNAFEECIQGMYKKRGDQLLSLLKS